jgi:hypothetical protein
VNFTRAFQDYTIIASSSNSSNRQITGSVTYEAKGSKSVQIYTYGYGESVNARVPYLPTYLNIIAFGNLNDFEVTLDKSVATGDCDFTPPNGCRAISEPVTATVKGGTAPFSYQWSYVGGAPNFQIARPTSDVTTFFKTGTQDAESGYFLVTVTDSLGKKARSELVEARLTRRIGGESGGPTISPPLIFLV